MSTPPTPPGSPPAGQAHLLATGSLVQQVAQVTGLLTMFAILTVLARRLSLAELGVYGLLTSLAGYLLVVQNSAASAAVRAMAGARDAEARTRTFSTATVVYLAAGSLTGILLAAVGLLLAQVVGLPPDLQAEARAGALLLGLVTALGWPITVHRDALRASQLFVRAAGVEIAALVVYAALVLGLAFADASLAILIGASGTIPLLVGLGSALATRLTRLPFRLRLGSVTRGEVRELAGLAWYVSLTEAAGTVVYALDRVVLGVLRSAATVGLYEGPVRAHNLVRSLNGAVAVTVLPSASRYLAERDAARLRELLVRGCRYTLALTVPLTVTGMVLAAPILEAWLGERYVAGAATMAILLSYWLWNGCSGVLSGIVVAGGRARTLARYAWSMAIANLALSIALTAWIGLEGVAIGTAVPYMVMFPFVVRLALGVAPVDPRVLLRQAFLPAWAGGAVLAAALGAVRVVIPLEGVTMVAAVALGGVLAYWALFYLVWLAPHERRLVRQVAVGLTPAAVRRS